MRFTEYANYRVRFTGPVGALIYLFVLLLWLVALFFPAFVILSVGFLTDSLTKWEVWFVAIIAQGLWWFFTVDD